MSLSTSITVDDVTHVILVTGFTSRLNEHVERIQRAIFNQFGAPCEVMFTFDKDNMPNLFIPLASQEKQNAAQSIISAIPENISINGSIGFKLLQDYSGIICFDIIDLLANIDGYCQPCGNVNKIHCIETDGKKVLILVYDCIDA